MLCVQMMATGKEVANLQLSEHPEMACVRALKRHLSSFCGCPRFKQRILRDGTLLADDTKLEVLAEQTLELVLLEFLPTAESEVQELLSAAANSHLAKLEALLQRPQDPDLGDEPPLLASCRDGHLEVVRLLLEAE
ncbi:Ank2, partial [Symbiodinium sp. KB8]